MASSSCWRLQTAYKQLSPNVQTAYPKRAVLRPRAKTDALFEDNLSSKWPVNCDSIGTLRTRWSLIMSKEQRASTNRSTPANHGGGAYLFLPSPLDQEAMAWTLSPSERQSIVAWSYIAGVVLLNLTPIFSIIERQYRYVDHIHRLRPHVHRICFDSKDTSLCFFAAVILPSIILTILFLRCSGG